MTSSSTVAILLHHRNLRFKLNSLSIRLRPSRERGVQVAAPAQPTVAGGLTARVDEEEQLLLEVCVRLRFSRSARDFQRVGMARSAKLFACYPDRDNPSSCGADEEPQDSIPLPLDRLRLQPSANPRM